MALDAPITPQEEGLCLCHFIRTPSKVTRPRTPEGKIGLEPRRCR
jgi:hypothetical protein